jgi:hypothetical protein
MTIIALVQNGFEMLVHYNNEGEFQHVLNTKTQKNMMVEFCQIGKGFEIEKSKDSFIPMMVVSNATYMYVIEANIYIPKFLFIKPE